MRSRPPVCRRLAALLVGLSVLAACARPASSPVVHPGEGTDDVLEAVDRARAAREAGDVAAFARWTARADSLAPGHPMLALNLARALAAAGDAAGTMRTLERLAPLGLATDPADDPALSVLRDRPGFGDLRARLAASAAPLVRSDTLLVVPGADRLPESVAHDPATGRWLLGSLLRPRIVSVGADGDTATFAAEAEPGWTVGMRADPVRRRLWVAVARIDSTAPPLPSGERARSALHLYDLDDGRLLRRLSPSDASGPHLFNDLAVAEDGTVYATDTAGHAVWRVPPGADRLEPLAVAPPRFHWPNGVARSPDGGRLYVSHLEGISAVDPSTGRVVPLERPADVALADIDGLYACPGSLVAIQRMADFEQVTRLRLSADGLRVTAAEALERRHPAHEQPTTGVVAGGALVYVANSRFGRIGPGRTARVEEGEGGTVLLRLPLEDGCR